MPDIGVGNEGWDFLSRPTGDDGESYSDDDGGWGYRESFTYHYNMIFELKAWLESF